ncbi:MAG: hypothetical protein ACOYNZ_13950 [Rhodoferax sp.]
MNPADRQAFEEGMSRILQIPVSTETEFDIDPQTQDTTDPENEMENETPSKPANKTLRTISAIQLGRLEKLTSEFKKRDKKPVYIHGLVHADAQVKVWLNFLKRDPSGTARIVRNGEKVSVDSGRSYTKMMVSEFGAIVDEHCVLDLVETAAKLLPGFEKASARRYRETVQAFVAKAAVAPIPYDALEPPLVFQSPLLGHSQILPSAILNALAMGGTGSGKTYSFMLPALLSMLVYRLSGGKTASLLVIDPKVELLSGIETKLSALGEPERLVVVGQCDPINYFQEDDGLSVTDRFEKVKSFATVTGNSTEDNRWQVFAEQLILSFLKDDQRFADATGLALLESVAAIVTGQAQYLDRNQWVALRKLLMLGMEDHQNLRHICDVYDVLIGCVGMKKADRPFARYAVMKDGEQFFYNARSALTILDKLGNEDIEHLMDLSVRRGLLRKSRTDVAELIGRGAILVFQPRQTATHDLVGGALKSLFFRCVMEREDMLRPIGYICDEFQRFITVEPETGEHAFLDRCRAYRVNTFLATQSIAALLAATNRDPNGSSTLDSILTNTPTKLCFRTTDERAVATMKSFIPRDPRSDQHVLNCRPPSSLLVGEYYFAFQDTWGRTRYQLPPRNESAS